MDNFNRYTSDWFYASSTAFFVSGDQRNVFVPGTRVRWSQTVGVTEVVKYGVVSSTAYSSPKTTITLDSESDAVLNCNIYNPCYTYEYLVPSTTPSMIPDIITAQIDDQAITTAKIADAAITPIKLADPLNLTASDVRFSVKEGTPVNAVAATGTLTFTENAAQGQTVTIGTDNYVYVLSLGTADAATGTLTLTGNAQNDEEVVIGSSGNEKTYTFKTALTEAKAAGVLTASDNFADAETVTIGSKVYKFTVNLSTPAVANEVKIGAAATNSLDNLIAAINGAAGAGTTYGTGTVAHTLVTAAAGAGDTIDLTAKTIGVAGNAIATTVVCANASFGAETLENGADAVVDEVLIAGSASASIDNLIVAITHGTGEGTAYSTGTAASTEVTASAGAGDTMTVSAIEAGILGNDIATTTTMANASFGGATLTGGEIAEEANNVLIGAAATNSLDNLIAAINKAAGEGSTYGTGTIAHTLVTAAAGDGDTMTLTAKVKGDVGNAVETTTDVTGASWGAATLEGGVDGTVGAKYELYANANYLYVASAANTTAGQNWRRISLGSAY